MAQIHDLTLIELAAAIRSGELSPVAVTDHYLRRTTELNDQVGAFYTVTAELAAEQAAEAEKAVAAAAGQGDAAAPDRRAHPDQGPEHGGRGQADPRLGRVREQRARRRRQRGHPDPAGRRGDDRQDRDPGVRAALLHRDQDRPARPHPVGPVQVRGRLERRRGRRGGRGPGPGRPGQRRRRLHPHPVQRLRPVRDQAVPRPGLRGPARARPGRPGRQRPAGAHRGRRRAAARRDGATTSPATCTPSRRCPRARRSSATPAASPAGCGSAAPCRTRSRAPRSTRTASRPTSSQRPAGEPRARGRGHRHAARPGRGAVLRDALVRLRHAGPAQPGAGGGAPPADPLPARPRRARSAPPSCSSPRATCRR